jgi:serine/threonine protein kinase
MVNSESVNTNLTFYRDLLTGYELEQLAGVRDFAKRTIIQLHNNDSFSNESVSIQQTILHFEGVAVVIEGTMYLDSPFRTIAVRNRTLLPTPEEEQSGSFYNKEKQAMLDGDYLANCKVSLSRNASLIVSHGGTLALLTASIVENKEDLSSPSIINYGNVSLLGITGNFFSDETKFPTPSRAARIASLGSLTTALSVFGEVIQTQSGQINVVLNSSYQDVPVIHLESNLYLSGYLTVSFYLASASNDDDVQVSKIYPNLSLYDTTTPSHFEVLRFRNYSQYPELGADMLPITIAAPMGLGFNSIVSEVSVTEEDTGDSIGLADSDRSSRTLLSVLLRGAGDHGNKMTSIVSPASLIIDSDTDNITETTYSQKLTISKIGCAQMVEYYSNYAYSVSIDTSYACHICLSNSSCELCHDGQCAVRGQCKSGMAFSGSCCSPQCTQPYGTCIPVSGTDDYTSFTCDCSWFYSGGDCRRISTNGIITIFSCCFAVVALFLSLGLYRRAVQQRNKVLEELKEGILRHTESGNNEYIQTMQQALILNDVFVKFEEIKLESQIGEGSFGVVHKATFRGAQVAVKQMRSMFLELTEKDIEEFRKEAYMMSRLRHPNIVLVMGISLVDQEPLPLPKSRSKRLSPSDEAEISPLAEGTQKKRVAQKTVCIITEYLEQGSLADILYGPTRLPAEIWTYELILTCALQAARGMLYLHSHHPPICHRDLKSSNLVVDDHWVVKVTDFGMSRIVPDKVHDTEKGVDTESDSLLGNDVKGDREKNPDKDRESQASEREYDRGVSFSSQSPYMSNRGARLSISALSSHNPAALEMTSNLGTTAWCAPELLTASSRTRYSVKVDVYSFGMVLWELWEKKRPFDELTSRFDIMDAVRAGKRPPISDNCPPTYKSLITRCWHGEASRRPTFNYIVRYLKDELARVKRNKALSQQQQAQPMPATTTALTGSQREPQATNRSSLMSSYFRPSFSTVQKTMSDREVSLNNSNTGNVPTVTSNGGSRRGSGGSISLTVATNQAATIDNAAAVAPGVASAADPAAVHNPLLATTPIVDVVVPATATVPATPVPTAPMPIAQQRTALVKAFDRSLSYLAESPSLASPVQQPGFAAKYSASQAWRDRYVMRFSGWNSSNPDSGLPPPRARMALPQPTATPEIPVGRSNRDQQRERPMDREVVAMSPGRTQLSVSPSLTSASTSADTQSIFMLDQDTSQSSTLQQARISGVEMADEIHAQNNSM